MSTARRLLPWAGAGFSLATSWAAWPFTIDDAFILARYARRIATGAGYTMNDGPPTDGVTGPLGLVPGILGQLAWGDPVFASKLAGALAVALAIALIVARAARESAARAWVAMIVAAGGATLGIWSVAGLETGLATLALTIAALLATRASVAPRDGAGVGLAIAALAWLRPELALASGVLLLGLWRRDRGAGAIAWAAAILGAASVVAFRVSLFDSPLPLSAQAKPPDLANGAEYVARGIIVALGGGGALVSALAAREGRREERLLALVLLAHLVALSLAGGDWMPGFRLFAPVMPAYALLVSRPIAARVHGRRGRAIALLAACASIPALDLALELPRARDAAVARETTGAELADYLAARATRVAMVDVGFVPYRAGVEVVDLGGITDPSIGRCSGAHLDKRIDPALLRERNPDAIVLHSSVQPRVDEEGRLRWLAGYPVERQVAEMAWVRAEMRVARVFADSPAYFYVVLTRSAAASDAQRSGSVP